MISKQRLSDEIIKAARRLPEGKPLTAKLLLHLGQRAAVDQALARLARKGQLLRVARGAYALPVRGPFGTRSPSSTRLVEGLSAQTGEAITRQGADAANGLGLTTQVPTREVYWTSGRTRTLPLGGAKVELRHVSSWKLVLPGRPAGELIRAMAWLGPERASEAVQLANEHLKPREVREVLALRHRLPTWVAKEISALAPLSSKPDAGRLGRVSKPTWRVGNT